MNTIDLSMEYGQQKKAHWKCHNVTIGKSRLSTFFSCNKKKIGKNRLRLVYSSGDSDVYLL